VHLSDDTIIYMVFQMATLVSGFCHLFARQKGQLSPLLRRRVLLHLVLRPLSSDLQPLLVLLLLLGQDEHVRVEEPSPGTRTRSLLVSFQGMHSFGDNRQLQRRVGTLRWETSPADGVAILNGTRHRLISSWTAPPLARGAKRCSTSTCGRCLWLTPTGQ
jgi:hypothetical protein